MAEHEHEQGDKQEPGNDQPGGCDSHHGQGHGQEQGQGHGHSHHDLRAASRRALRLALVVLSIFFVVEIVGGVLTNSLALISDAAHLLTDVAAVALALVAQWFAGKPGDSARSFGYRRVEILAAQLNGMTLILVALYIGYEALQRMSAPPEVLSWPMIIVASVGLVAQLITTVVLGRAQGESLNVRGAYVHAMTDAVQSVGVVAVGLLMAFTGWYIADPIVSLLIAVLIAYSGGKIIWEATHVLIEGTPRELDLDEIAAVMRAVSGVVRVTDLHAWSLTSGYNALSAHVEAAPDLDHRGYETLRRQLTEGICTRFSVQHVTLQVERECELCKSGCCAWLAEPGADDARLS